MLRYESNNFALAVQLHRTSRAEKKKKKKDLFRFVSSLRLKTIEYEVRNTILSLKRLNNRMVMDPVSVFRVTGKLHAMLYSG